MNKQELVSNIKLLLGGSVVSLEVADEDIERLIDMALVKIRPFVTETEWFTFVSIPKINLARFGVVDVVRVVSASYGPLGSSTVPELTFGWEMFQSQGRAGVTQCWAKTVQADADVINRMAIAIMDDVTYPFRYVDGYLHLSQGRVYGNIACECYVKLTVEGLREEQAVSWVSSYSLALVKETIGRIRSKFTSSTLPVSLDGQALLSEGLSEKEKLEEELRSSNFGTILYMR